MVIILYICNVAIKSNTKKWKLISTSWIFMNVNYLKIYYIAPHFKALFTLIRMVIILYVCNVAIKSYTEKWKPISTSWIFMNVNYLKMYYTAPHFKALFTLITMVIIIYVCNVVIKSYAKKWKLISTLWIFINSNYFKIKTVLPLILKLISHWLEW